MWYWGTISGPILFLHCINGYGSCKMMILSFHFLTQILLSLIKLISASQFLSYWLQLFLSFHFQVMININSWNGFLETTIMFKHITVHIQSFSFKDVNSKTIMSLFYFLIYCQDIKHLNGHVLPDSSHKNPNVSRSFILTYKVQCFLPYQRIFFSLYYSWCCPCLLFPLWIVLMSSRNILLTCNFVWLNIWGRSSFMQSRRKKKTWPESPKSGDTHDFMRLAVLFSLSCQPFSHCCLSHCSWQFSCTSSLLISMYMWWHVSVDCSLHSPPCQWYWTCLLGPVLLLPDLTAEPVSTRLMC